MYSFSISLWTQRGRAAIRFGLVADTLEPDTRFHQRAVPSSRASFGKPRTSAHYASRGISAPRGWLVPDFFPGGLQAQSTLALCDGVCQPW